MNLDDMFWVVDRDINSAERESVEGAKSGYPFINRTLDWQLVNLVHRAMTLKLQRAREKGRFGWWCNHTCTISDLENMLNLEVAKQNRDYIDIINLAAMIWVRKTIQQDDLDPALKELDN